VSGAAPDSAPGTRAASPFPAVPAAATAARPTWRGKAWFWAPAVPLVALDLWSKSFFWEYIPAHGRGIGYGGRPAVPVFETDAVGFMLVQAVNTGTIWGLFRDFTIPLMVLRSAAIVLLCWFAWRAPATKRLLLLVLGLILAGAIGNLYDNFTQPHRGVRDFLRFYGRWPWEWDFPAFNVADSCICVGAFTLAFLLWRQPQPGVAPPARPGP
jgi:signal peptidase II